MSLDQAQTFEWLVGRSNRLDEAEARIVALELELARLRVKPIVDRMLQAEDTADLWNLRFEALSKAENALSSLCDECWTKHSEVYSIVEDALRISTDVYGLLRSWKACMEIRPSDWELIAKNILEDTTEALNSYEVIRRNPQKVEIL